MISKRNLRLAALLPLVSIITACAGNRLPLDACPFPDPGSKGAQAPEWVCSLRLEGGPRITGIGSEKIGDGSGLDTTRRLAVISATTQIASVIEIAVKDLIRVNETRVGDVKSRSADRVIGAYVSQDKLRGVRILAQTTSPGGHYYVLAGLQPEIAVEVMNGAIKAVNKSVDTIDVQKLELDEAFKRYEEADKIFRSGG